ncbi:hypothetical protein DFH28DRAFT_945285 [Melampsora americana]|nr:hypothetical protein DFH28DRAFT_945285 [Melampsora americana]
MMGRSIHEIESKFNKSIEKNENLDPKERYDYLSEVRFPRNDILDLSSVRVARSQIHELKNDLKSIIEEISKTLPLLLKPSSSASLPKEEENETETESNLMKPFAQVDLVSENSPAQLSGLKIGDQLIRFGTIDHSNHDQLKALVSFTNQNEGNPIGVNWFRIQKDQNGNCLRTMMSQNLIPKSGWGGRGLLGFVRSFLLSSFLYDLIHSNG